MVSACKTRCGFTLKSQPCLMKAFDDSPASQINILSLSHCVLWVKLDLGLFLLNLVEFDSSTFFHPNIVPQFLVSLII